MNSTALPIFTIQDLFEAGAHYGHKTMRWNPKMAPYLYGSRNGIHIIDLQQTYPMLYQALQAAYDVTKRNGRILFVGTKRQASDITSEEARRCGQYYVNYRWLGGMLTNFDTISASIKVMVDTERLLLPENAAELAHYTKKEILELTRRYAKLERSLGGIRNMGGKPDLLFVVDTNKENIAIQEAQKLNIPVIAILDSNSDPDGITYPVPGNDDAGRSIRLYCKLMSDAILAGIQDSMVASGVDLGSLEKAPVEASIELATTETKEKPPTKGEAKKAAAEKPAEPAKKPVVVEKVTRRPAAAKKDAEPSEDAKTA